MSIQIKKKEDPTVNSFKKGFAIREAFRGGICGPNVIYASAPKLAERKSELEGREVDPADMFGKLIDVNSQVNIFFWEIVFFISFLNVLFFQSISVSISCDR